VEIPFFTAASERGEDGFTDIRLQNLFPATEPQLLKQLGRRAPSLTDMPGSRRFGNLGADAVRGVFYYPGGGATQMLAVAGTTLSRVDSAGAATSLGTVSGTDRIGWDMIRDITLICADRKVWYLASSSLTQVTDVDLGDVTAIAALNGRLIAARDASDTFVWSDVLTPSTIGSLSFATAEAYGDKLVRPFVHGRRLYLFGERSLELWGTGPSSGSAFARIGDAVEPFGLAAKHSLDAAGPAMCFVAIDQSGAISVQSFDNGMSRISSPMIDDMLAGLSESDLAAVEGFSFTTRGQTFYQIDLPGVGSYAYHFQSGQWLRRKWAGDVLWRGRCATYAYGKIIAGSRIDGKLYALEPRLYADDVDGDEFPLERVATTFIGARQTTRLSSLALDCGVRGAGVQPLAQIAVSADDGQTWTKERPVELAAQGARSRKARNWAPVRDPGALVRARFTGDHGVALGGLLVNEPGV